MNVSLFSHVLLRVLVLLHWLLHGHLGGGGRQMQGAGGQTADGQKSEGAQRHCQLYEVKYERQLIQLIIQ